MAWGFDHALTMLRKRTESWLKQLDEKTTKRDDELEARIVVLEATVADHESRIASLEALAHSPCSN